MNCSKCGNTMVADRCVVDACEKGCPAAVDALVTELQRGRNIDPWPWFVDIDGEKVHALIVSGICSGLNGPPIGGVETRAKEIVTECKAVWRKK